ncbi:MAG: inositol monophosphatase family protein [bacterium JZ-2024 1]
MRSPQREIWAQNSEKEAVFSTTEQDAIRAVAVETVVSAGEIIVRHYEHLDPRETRDKGINDLVTPVDHEVEAYLRDRLTSAYPDFGFIGEEMGGGTQASSIFWVADPIDGTTNFAHGFPYFCISLALNESADTLFGLVYDPLRHELFEAWRGKGAFRNGTPIRVAQRDTLVSALIASGFPNRALFVFSRYENIYRRCLQAGAGIRRTGSAALDLAHIAAGRLDGTFQFGISLWDYAAGALIVTESGGTVVVYADTGTNASQSHIFAGSPYVVRQLLAFDALRDGESF